MAEIKYVRNNGKTSFTVKVKQFGYKMKNWLPGRVVEMNPFYHKDTDTKLQLNIFPNGATDQEEGHISIFLTNTSNHTVWLDYEIICGTQFASSGAQGSRLDPNCGLGKSEFVEHFSCFCSPWNCDPDYDCDEVDIISSLGDSVDDVFTITCSITELKLGRFKGKWKAFKSPHLEMEETLEMKYSTLQDHIKNMEEIIRRNNYYQEQQMENMEKVLQKNNALQKQVNNMEKIAQRNNALEEKLCNMEDIVHQNDALKEQYVSSMEKLVQRNNTLEERVKKMEEIIHRNIALEDQVNKMEKLIQRNNAMNKTLEEHIHSMFHAFEEQEKENEKIDQKNNALEEQVNNIENIINRNNNSMEKLVQSINALEEKMKSIEENTSLQEDVKSMKNTIHGFEETLDVVLREGYQTKCGTCMVEIRCGDCEAVADQRDKSKFERYGKASALFKFFTGKVNPTVVTCERTRSIG